MLYSILIVAQIIFLVLCVLMSIVILFSKNSINQELLSMISLSTVLQLGGYLSEMLARSLDIAIFSVKLELVGLLLINTFMLVYISRCCDYQLKRTLRILFMSIDLIMIAVGLTCEYHNLFYTTMVFEESGLFPHLEVTYGPLFYLCLLFNFSLIVYQIVLVWLYYRRNRTGNTKALMLLVLAYLLPMLGLVYDFTPLKDKYTYEPFFLSVFIAIVYFFFIIVRFRLFDKVQIAKDDVLDNVQAGLIIIDTNRRLLYANKFVKELYPELKNGYSQANVINQIYRNNKKLVEIGSQVFYVGVNAFYSGNILQGYRLWLIDKTEERKTHKQMERAIEEAKQANEAKTVFLANMSHEIRTPMNAILGTTDIMLKESISPEIEEHIISIKNAGMTLISIINNVLDFSKIEAGKMKTTIVDYSPGLLIKEVTDSAKIRLEQKGVGFKVYVKDTLPRVMRGDDTQVKQIFSNILNNAVKYTKSGYVTVIVDWEQADGVAKIRVSVEDTGCGIPEEELPNIFNTFERVDMIKNRTIEGTGLGLPIAKRLVESLGGSINVKSIYGEGTTFTFTYFQAVADYTPMGRFEDLKYENPEEQGDTFIAPMAKILVVDDNITNIKVIQGILSIYQIRVDVALGGMEAVEKAAKNHYHMILMDQMMPVVDGIEAARLIRQGSGYSASKTPIIALTANAIRGAREMFITEGFQDYLSKPIDIKHLERILKSFLPGEFIRYVERQDNTVVVTGNFSIPGVDVEKGIENYGGSRARYIQVLKYIFTDGEVQYERMKKQLKDKDYEAFAFEIHALKGLAYGIGAEKFGNAAAAGEKLARENRFDELEESMVAFLDRYRVLLANIKFVLEENNVVLDDAIKVVGSSLSKEEMEQQLVAVLASAEMLEQQEIEKKLIYILSTDMEPSLRQRLEKVRNANIDFEYEDVVKMINEILNNDLY